MVATWNRTKEEYSGNFGIIYSSGKFHAEYSGCQQDLMEVKESFDYMKKILNTVRPVLMHTLRRHTPRAI